MDPVTSMGWEKNSFISPLVPFLKWRRFSDISIKESIAMKICVVVYMYIYINICIFLFYYNLYIYVHWALVNHYFVSNKLQRIKTVNKMWWYKLLFSKLCFRAKYNFLYKRQNQGLLVRFHFHCILLQERQDRAKVWK